MGMFDYIEIEDLDDLPKPNEIQSLKDFEFQTKSLDRLLNFYVIGKDKFLYLKLSDSNENLQKINYHGIIKFGAYHPNDFEDYIIDYEAKFTDGILQKVELINFKSIKHEKKYKEIKIKKKSLIENIIIALQNIFIVYPLDAFGIKLNSLYQGIIQNDNFYLIFHFPIVKFFKYGFIIRNLDFELGVFNNYISKDLAIKFLGIGFVIKILK